MKQFILATGVATILAGGAALADAQDYPFEGYTEVEVAEGVVAALRDGPYQISAVAHSGNLSRLVIEQRGDTLYVERRSPVIRSALNPTDRFEVTIQMPELTRVSARSGASVTADVASATARFEGEAMHGASLRVTGIDADRSHLRASGGSALRFDGAAGAVEIAVRNGSAMTLSGGCTDMRAELLAGATLSAADMRCETLDVEAGAGADATVYGSQTATVEARFGAAIRVLGNPVLERAGRSFGGDIRLN